MNETDTIVALATAPGRGGIGIIRISGKQTQKITKSITGQNLAPRKAYHLPFQDHKKQEIDEGIALYFEKPNSFTGEDVLELQGHGGPVVLDMLLKEVVSLGARIARPGEFSQRAFLNDKMDLLKAEGIADLIAASSEQAVKSAINSLQGTFSQAINELVEKLIQLRMYVEAAIDFPEEEIDFLSDGKVVGDLENIEKKLQNIQSQANQGAILREGIQVVIAGKPNAGKSSLLNALSKRESAIVTHIPGTTRDLLKEEINIDGIPAHIIDTAGLRESEDEVEKIGIKRAWDQIEKADLLLMVVDEEASPNLKIDTLWSQLSKQKRPQIPCILIKNKIDKLSLSPKVYKEKHNNQHQTTIALSAKKQQGIDLLTTEIKKEIGYQQTGEGTYLARTRHLQALQKAAEAIEQGKIQILEFHAGELLAEELRQAQLSLSEITGAFSADDLLGEIFSSFCIGK